jgi:hypothetical protein
MSDKYGRSGESGPSGKPTHYIPAPGSAWRLCVPAGRPNLVYGAYDGHLRSIDRERGSLSWEIDTGGFIFTVAHLANRNGDDLFLAATSGGELWAVDARGTVKWRHQSSRPIYAATPIRLANGEIRIACGGTARVLRILTLDGSVVAERPVEFFVQRLASGDFDGDGTQELFLMDGREHAGVYRVEHDGLTEVWRSQIELPRELVNWENPDGTYKPFSIHVDDLDSDGVDEIVMGDSFNNRQTVLLLRGDGRIGWVSDPLEWWAGRSTWYEYFSTAFVATTEHPHELPGKKVISAAGGLLRLFSSDGTLLSSVESRLAFSDIRVDGDAMFLGSTPNGDETIYRVRLTRGWEDSVAGLERRGLAAEIGQTLMDVRRSVLETASSGPGAWLPESPPADQPKPPFELQHFSLSYDALDRATYARLVNSFEEQIPYKIFTHTISLRPLEPEPVPDEHGRPWNMRRFTTDIIHGTMTVEEIVAMARRIEEERLPTVFAGGHNCSPFIHLSTAERMLKAAPNYLVGFQTAEDVAHDTIGRYVRHFVGPLCDLCLEHGRKKVVIKNKVIWWLDAPANQDVYRELFAGRRREVIVAATEESICRWSDVNLMGRMSLYYAGLVGAMKVHIHRDMFSPNYFHQWECPKIGHPFLRMLITQTVMGGSIFSTAISDVITSRQRPHEGMEFNDLGHESTEIFFQLLGQGIVFPAAPSQFANLSPVGIVMHEPAEKWLVNAHNNHRPWLEQEDEQTLNGFLPQMHCGWGRSPLPDTSLSAILYRKPRVFDGGVPATPYGHVLLLPEHFDRSGLDWIDEWWHTDGVYLWREGGEPRLGAETGSALRASLERGTLRLPFRAERDDVFYQVLSLGPRRYRMFVIDPGWLAPKDRRVRMVYQRGTIDSVCTPPGGDRTPASDSAFDVFVPAGAFRVFDVRTS